MGVTWSQPKHAPPPQPTLQARDSDISGCDEDTGDGDTGDGTDNGGTSQRRRASAAAKKARLGAVSTGGVQSGYNAALGGYNAVDLLQMQAAYQYWDPAQQEVRRLEACVQGWLFQLPWRLAAVLLNLARLTMLPFAAANCRVLPCRSMHAW
jgi:hypothetical protein